MDREDFKKLPMGRTPVLFKGERAVLVKEGNVVGSFNVSLKHNKVRFSGGGERIKGFKYSWYLYNGRDINVHEPLNLSDIVFLDVIYLGEV